MTRKKIIAIAAVSALTGFLLAIFSFHAYTVYQLRSAVAALQQGQAQIVNHINTNIVPIINSLGTSLGQQVVTPPAVPQKK
jgi:hypothetical protein